MLDWVEEDLRARGHQVERVDVADKAIGGCMSCFKCQRDPEELVCAVEDDGLDILRKVADADAIIYATPVYCWGFTSQFKPLIDRHLCLVSGYTDPATHRSHIEGKRLSLLVTCGGPAGEGNTDTLTTVFGRMARFAKCQVAAELIVPGCFDPEHLGDEQREQARAFAAEAVA